MPATTISSHFVDAGIEGGLLMSVIAFSIVFLVIAALMLLMMALKFFSGGSGGSADNSAPQKAAQPAAAPASTAPHGTSRIVAQDDGELTAVITAAIAASLGRTVTVARFAPAAERARTSAWRVTGRLDNMEGFVD
jgi:Na+-transporting methylmalonyl-CoA/oxaloacetate decarboxylase gamma subunit